MNAYAIWHRHFNHSIEILTEVLNERYINILIAVLFEKPSKKDHFVQVYEDS